MELTPTHSSEQHYGMVTMYSSFLNMCTHNTVDCGLLCCDTMLMIDLQVEFHTLFTLNATS